MAGGVRTFLRVPENRLTAAGRHVMTPEEVTAKGSASRSRRASTLPTSNQREPVSHLELIALVVREYEPAIDFFVNVLQFELIEDVPSSTNDGRPKRWVVVRPAGAVTGILLARADGDQQRAIVG